MLCFFPVCFSNFTCFAFPLLKCVTYGWVSLYGRQFYFALITLGWVWHQWTDFTTYGGCTGLCSFVSQPTLFLLNYFLLFPYASDFFFSLVNLMFSHLHHQFYFRDQLHVIFCNTPSHFICVIFQKLFPYFMFLLAHLFFLLKFNFYFFNGTDLLLQVQISFSCFLLPYSYSPYWLLPFSSVAFLPLRCCSCLPFLCTSLLVLQLCCCVSLATNLGFCSFFYTVHISQCILG